EFIITLKNNIGETVVENKKLSIVSNNDGYYSGKLKLPIGQYSLVKAFVARKSGWVRFATPHAGFPKAQLINNPLPIAISRSTASERLLAIEMVPVQAN